MDGGRGPAQERRTTDRRGAAPRWCQGASRFGMAVDLPTQSDKTYVLHAQPPAFGATSRSRSSMGRARSPPSRSPYTVHDTSQLVVGIIAERPRTSSPRSTSYPIRPRSSRSILPLEVSDLPERVEAWQAIDRLVWQDIDSDTLTTAQLAALRGLGRLRRPAHRRGWQHRTGRPRCLPGRPLAVPAGRHDGRPGRIADGAPGPGPGDAPDLPALSGDLIAGRTPGGRRRSGDRRGADGRERCRHGHRLRSIHGLDRRRDRRRHVLAPPHPAAHQPGPQPDQ